ncbi:hypothetical protein BD289DRAFT_10860 [Coniella lustricola]|uniref:Uncharacterized protein n=1 Tax=Coniella lustricola TaxID=2025994 RepID=A0A2T3A4G2_9PEZI|nr:hypothetical protein BD289DRAFT_10860 [Coniella lustricola]
MFENHFFSFSACVLGHGGIRFYLIICLMMMLLFSCHLGIIQYFSYICPFLHLQLITVLGSDRMRVYIYIEKTPSAYIQFDTYIYIQTYIIWGGGTTVALISVFILWIWYFCLPANCHKHT